MNTWPNTLIWGLTSRQVQNIIHTDIRRGERNLQELEIHFSDSMSFIAPNFPLVVVKHHLLHPRGHQRQHSSRPSSPSTLNQMFQGNSTCSYNTSYFARTIKCNAHTAPSWAAAALFSWTLDCSLSVWLVFKFYAVCEICWLNGNWTGYLVWYWKHFSFSWGTIKNLQWYFSTLLTCILSHETEKCTIKPCKYLRLPLKNTIYFQQQHSEYGM